MRTHMTIQIVRKNQDGVALTVGNSSSLKDKLADALVRLRDQHRLTRQQAAAALLDLDSRSTRFIAASLLEAVAISAGVESTPGGLHLAA